MDNRQKKGRHGEGDPFGVLHCVDLGRQLRENKYDDHLEQGRYHDPERSDDLVGDDANERCSHQRADLEGKKDHRDIALGVLHQLQQGRRTALVLFDHGNGLDPRHPCHGRL